MAPRAGRRERPPVPAAAEGFRRVWAALQDDWEQTVERARGLDHALLHERVDDEWSFIETLRHLLFVTDAWAARALLGREAPYHPLDLPPTGMRNPALTVDHDARPSLDEVLGLREERVALVRDVMAGLIDDDLDGRAVRVRGPGYPRAGAYPVRRCVQTLIGEEWHHRRFAERDLGVLAERQEGVPGTGVGADA